MIAFDADILTEILSGNPELSQRASLIPVNEQTVPIVVIEEILRGRLNSIRQAEAAKSKLRIVPLTQLPVTGRLSVAPVVTVPRSETCAKLLASTSSTPWKAASTIAF
jgi:hypothetical protein